VTLMGSIAATEAIKLLVGQGALNPGMIHVDLWDNSFDQFELGGRRPDCPTCGQHAYPFLNAEIGTRTTVLCGRDAVQVSVVGAQGLSLPDLATRLQAAGAETVQANFYLLRAQIEGHEFTVFSDGRAIIKGTADEAVAATLYARYVGI